MLHLMKPPCHRSKVLSEGQLVYITSIIDKHSTFPRTQ